MKDGGTPTAINASLEILIAQALRLQEMNEQSIRDKFFLPYCLTAHWRLVY